MTRPVPSATLDIARVRGDFPALAQEIHGKPLVYLDSAATSQKPRAVIDAMTHFYETSNANVHRGVHTLSVRATELYEGAREKLRALINAGELAEVVFVRGTTEGINLVANSFGMTRVKAGDEVVISAMEHHSNIVPWQMLCDEKGAKLRVVPLNDLGEVRLDEVEALIGDRTRIVSVAHVSNALGTILPVRRIVEMAHAKGAVVLVDGAQAVPRLPVDVRALGCDFYTFSSHKLYGPTGIGVLYAREELLASMPPWQGGGDMIRTVTFEKSTYNDLPFKFEAGTPNISGAVGLAAAIDYVEGLGLEAIAAHEHKLLVRATAEVSKIAGVELIGTAAHKAAVLSFTIAGVHPHDIGTILDHEGVAVRTGHHCAMPVMDFFGVPATARASFGCYNTFDDVERLVAALHETRKVFA